MCPKSRRRRKLQFSDRHFKFPTEFRQTDANFRHIGLWMPKVLTLPLNLAKCFSASNFSLMDKKFRTRDFFHNFPTAQNIGGQLPPVPFSATTPLFNTVNNTVACFKCTVPFLIQRNDHDSCFDLMQVRLQFCRGHSSSYASGRWITLPHID